MSRSIIVVRVGYWEDHLVVDFLPEDEPLLAEAGLTEGVEVVFEDNALWIGPGANGKGVYPSDIRQSGDNNTLFQREFDLYLEDSRSIARFCMHEIEAVIEEGLMTIELALPHLLPWFSLSGRASSRPDLKQICIREFARRMHSAVQAGEIRIFVPTVIRQFIPAELWASIMRKARGV